MILWVKAEAAKSPVNQRVSVIDAQDPNRIVVRRCGDEVLLDIKASDIVGVEISKTVTFYGGK